MRRVFRTSLIGLAHEGNKARAKARKAKAKARAMMPRAKALAAAAAADNGKAKATAQPLDARGVVMRTTGGLIARN